MQHLLLCFTKVHPTPTPPTGEVHQAACTAFSQFLQISKSADPPLLQVKYAKLLATLATEVLEAWKKVENSVLSMAAVGFSYFIIAFPFTCNYSRVLWVTARRGGTACSASRQCVFVICCSLFVSLGREVCAEHGVGRVHPNPKGSLTGSPRISTRIHTDPHGSTPLALQVGLAVDEEASSEAGAVCAAAAGLLDQLFPAVLAALRTGNDEIAAAAVPFLLSYVTRLKAVQVCCLAKAGVQECVCARLLGVCLCVCWGAALI